MANDHHNIGDRVKWKWGNGWAEGEIEEVHTEKVVREIKGSEITRVADGENPAYYIKQDDGDAVLKSHTEV